MDSKPFRPTMYPWMGSGKATTTAKIRYQAISVEQSMASGMDMGGSSVKQWSISSEQSMGSNAAAAAASLTINNLEKQAFFLSSLLLSEIGLEPDEGFRQGLVRRK